MTERDFTPCGSASDPVGYDATTYHCERPTDHGGYCQGSIRDEADHIIGTHHWFTPDRRLIFGGRPL